MTPEVMPLWKLRATALPGDIVLAFSYGQVFWRRITGFAEIWLDVADCPAGTIPLSWTLIGPAPIDAPGHGCYVLMRGFQGEMVEDPTIAVTPWRGTSEAPE